jgi:hypothetical protein
MAVGHLVAAIAPISQTGSIFSTTPIFGQANQLLDCLIADRRTDWAAALAAGVLFGVYISDRRKRPASDNEVFTPHQIFR